MYHIVRNILMNNTTLKLIAIGIGYTVWSLLGAVHYTTQSFTVPLCFYNVPDNISIQAPEEISVQIAGYRNELHTLRSQDIAAHYDAQTLHRGTYTYRFGQENFFLPSTVSVVHCTPSTCEICCKKE
jgi:hypothetical protein